jgi:hypothetical protein
MISFISFSYVYLLFFYLPYVTPFILTLSCYRLDFMGISYVISYCFLMVICYALLFSSAVLIECSSRAFHCK